jgi:hypothetical protein
MQDLLDRKPEVLSILNGSLCFGEEPEIVFPVDFLI